MEKTVYDLLEEFTKYQNIDRDFIDFRIDSECGRCCSELVAKASQYKTIADPHPHVVKPLEQSVIAACEVVCFG